MEEEMVVEGEKQDYEEVLKKLEDMAKVEAWLTNPEWEPFRKAWAAIVKGSQKQIVKVSPDDKSTLIKLQTNINFYEDVMKETINQYRLIGRDAYEEAKDNGWLNSIASTIKQLFI